MAVPDIHQSLQITTIPEVNSVRLETVCLEVMKKASDNTICGEDGFEKLLRTGCS